MSENKKARIGMDFENHAIIRNGHTFVYEISEAIWNTLSDRDKRVLLHGWAQYIGDAPSGMTLKTGFTPEERLAVMIEKAAEINKGLFKQSSANGEKVIFKNVRANAVTCTSMNELQVLRKIGLASKEQLAKLDEFEKSAKDRLEADSDENEK